jgi:NAD(P)H-dependent flavin oxidoreductase YrpB (nitropropane dioxygenase family)
LKINPLKIGKYVARVPIIQGGMAVRLSQANLAAAVAEEGGIGVIAASGIPIDEVISEVRKARSLTNGLIGINIMVASKLCIKVAEAAADNGADIIFCGAGFSKDIFKIRERTKAEVVPIVSSDRLAKISEKQGAQAIVVESGEAGGHLGTRETLAELLPQIVNSVNVPVIGAGGIVDPEDALRVFNMGVSGIQMGSRFVTTHESSAPENLKKIYITCNESDIVEILSPLGLPGRAIQNRFLEGVQTGLNQSFDHMKCEVCMKHCKKNYCILDSLDRVQQGEVDNGILFAGKNMYKIKEILSVKQVMEGFYSELSK